MDGRLSSPKLKKQTKLGLCKSGCNVIDLGLNPTPVLYFGNHNLRSDGAIQITGSHNPKDYNGFKIVLKNKPFFGKDIQNLGKKAEFGSEISLTGNIENINLDEKYIKKILMPLSRSTNLRDKKIIWDCGNGATGNIIKKIIKFIPCKSIVLYSEIDGNFPNHHPDPSNANNLIKLKQEIKKQNADFGFAFDGDGDRLGVVNNKLQLIAGDILTTFLAQSVSDKKNPIILDVKSSQKCKNFLEDLNYKVIIWKTGHSHIKNKMKEINSKFAGEMSGHIFFGDTYYGYDDAIYSSIRFLELVEKKFKLNEFLNYFKNDFSTPEIKIKCPDEKKFSIIENFKLKIQDKYSTENCNFIDGIRVDLDIGWYLIRASNTENSIIIRIDGNTKENFVNLSNEVQALLKSEKLNIDHSS
tara:strand:- start:156 stop:1391 length:1236 start_codon:yes stop_codon:yes gene_type:complete